jgi:hypothetical protein
VTNAEFKEAITAGWWLSQTAVNDSPQSNRFWLSIIVRSLWVLSPRLVSSPGAIAMVVDDDFDWIAALDAGHEREAAALLALRDLLLKQSWSVAA